MQRESSNHMTYLLRLWRAGGADDQCWRAALENPHSGERQVFRDLAGLFAFLEQKTHGPSHPLDDQDPGVPSPGEAETHEA